MSPSLLNPMFYNGIRFSQRLNGSLDHFTVIDLLEGVFVHSIILFLSSLE